MTKLLRNDILELKQLGLDEVFEFQGDLKELTTAAYEQFRDQLLELGFSEPITVWFNDNRFNIINGHQRVRTLRQMASEGIEVPTQVPAIVIRAASIEEAKKKVLALTSQYGRITKDGLYELMTGAGISMEYVAQACRFPEIDIPAFQSEYFDNPSSNSSGTDGNREVHNKLADRFLVPPFSVLDTRQGYWKKRKDEWMAVGIKSEVGRGESTDPDGKALLYASQNGLNKLMGGKGFNTGTSVFDPVLCELACRWFSPVAGYVLDPFADGSVRGIVAAMLGRFYVGIDLRKEQVEANQAQWDFIKNTSKVVAGALSVEDTPDNTPELTPIEKLGDVWVKRDDQYSIAGVCGGKVRTCWSLAQGAIGLVTAGSRASPQVNIVAHIAKRLGVPCRVHTPNGELSPEVQAARDCGAEVVQHKAGYNNVIIARARDDAKEKGWTEIPFGMECAEAIAQTRRQVKNIPEDVKRIVMPVGSGMSLSGVLWGLRDAGLNIPVLGVVVGANPGKRLEQYAPQGWQQMATLVQSKCDYHAQPASTEFQGLQLDPHYEAKCIEHLQPGDMLWVVGIRQTEQNKPNIANAADAPDPMWFAGDSRQMDGVIGADTDKYDLVFTCPPYADLEVYSDDPADISNMDYAQFRDAYRDIIAEAVRRLRQDRFAVVVVGEVREKSGGGFYRNFVRDTIEAFEAAGARHYNEIVLVNCVGSLALRCARPFVAARKVGKTHQNVIVFCKGDPAKAAEACGVVDIDQAIAENTDGDASDDAGAIE